MSSLNKYKLVEQKCEMYYKILERDLNREISLRKESDNVRFGFYLYILECLTNIKETDELIKRITDTDFNTALFNDKSSDSGIDAVYIDDENQTINLFNFKYRENYNPNKMQSKNDVFISTKFITAIINGNTSHLEGKIKSFSDEIVTRNESKNIWNMKLYMVTNENKPLEKNDGDIKQLEEAFDLEIVPICLKDIANFMSNRPEGINAKIVLNNESVLSYTEGSLVSAKSFLIKIPISELIRITCDDKACRYDFSTMDISPLVDKGLEYGVLFDNVRGFLGDTKYNANIYRTLKDEPSKFFMYNNGLTITAKDVISEEFNGRKMVSIEIKNFQVVNGGQTLRTIHKFNQQSHDNLENYLCDAEVLVRVFKTGDNYKLTNKIAEYTNSQNAISIIDLKSIAEEQTQIEQILDDNNIIYARKIGDTGISEDKEYDYKISLEKFAQILYSMHGNPDKASNQKKKIFEKYYDDTFGESNFDISKSADIVRRYYEIKNKYESSTTYESSEQKIFYILYLDGKVDSDMDKNIERLEEALVSYEDGDLKPTRKLIRTAFKEYLDKSLGI
ncbi:AIPR protein [Clostridium cadaveris]|uniref:AIPR protein n=1 Tax=Clostridium cadaveris TaxID=1529 RepID=A0A1I2MCP8_9CLOT|nr:AIPR family protein [Clostridium cadaveris]MDM8313092.1 AIPR family protein [Clostridium cadaveris]SFF87327.1 AIPR protein [Clostridium cadaveris]